MKDVSITDELSISLPDDATPEQEEAAKAMVPAPATEPPETRQVEIGEGLSISVADNATDEEVEALQEAHKPYEEKARTAAEGAKPVSTKAAATKSTAK